MGKIILIILFITSVFAGELEVDGNLKVTGSIESTTIENLEQQNSWGEIENVSLTTNFIYDNNLPGDVILTM